MPVQTASKENEEKQAKVQTIVGSYLSWQNDGERSGRVRETQRRTTVQNDMSVRAELIILLLKLTTEQRWEEE